MVDKNDRFLPEYGDLNKLQDNLGKHRLDISPTHGGSINSIRKTVQRTYTSKEISPGPYTAIVLRVQSDNDSVFTKIGQYLSDANLNNWSVKARIPELHGHIPSPSNIGETSDVSREDDDLIKSHTSFRPRSSKSLKEPSPGDYIRVEYINGIGVYLGPLVDSKGNPVKVARPKKGVSSKSSFKAGLDAVGDFFGGLF